MPRCTRGSWLALWALLVVGPGEMAWSQSTDPAESTAASSPSAAVIPSRAPEPAASDSPANVASPNVGPRVAVAALRVGCAELYKTGRWTSVRVELQGGTAEETGRLWLETTDPEGVSVAFPAGEELRIEPRQTTTVEGYACVFQRAARITARWEVAGRAAVRRTYAVDADAPADRIPEARATHESLHVVLGSAVGDVGSGDVGLDALAKATRDADGDQRLVWRQVTDLASLPADRLGLDGIDGMWLSLDQTLSTSPMAAQALKTLLDWVRQGGRLIVLADADQATWQEPSPWRELAPGRLLGVQTLRSWSALEQFSESNLPIEAVDAQSGRAYTVQVPHFTDLLGVVEAQEVDLPLVTRRSLGGGQIVFLATRLDRTPLATWGARPAVLARLWGLPGWNEAAQAVAKPGGKQVSWSGITDLAGQLYAALDIFAGVRQVPFWWVAVAMLCYVALVGPVDWWLARRVMPRAQWTWLWFLGGALLVSGMAWWLSVRWKGSELLVNQAELVDVDLASGQVRRTLWCRLFSPRAQGVDVRIEPVELPLTTTAATAPLALATAAVQPATGQQPAVSAPLAPSGIAGTGIGGMDHRRLVAASWTEGYALAADRAEARAVPMAAWSSKGFWTSWSTPATSPAFTGQVLRGQDDVPRGSITSHLAVPLTDCLFACGRWAIALEEGLDSGETLDLGDVLLDAHRTELRTRLTGRAMVYDEGSKQFVQRSRAYDPLSSDIEEVLRQMMFYEAAGGSAYSRLRHGLFRQLDYSPLLAADRALLVGRVAEGSTRVVCSAQSPVRQDRRVVWFRFVFPVAREKAQP